MQIWLFTGFLGMLIFGIWASIPIFAVVVGTGLGILVLHEFIKMMDEE